MRWPLQSRPIVSCAILALAMFWVGVPWAATHDLEAGADLAVAAQQATDGDVLRLKAGRYSGPALADGKRLTIVGPADGEAVVAPGQSNVVFAAVNGGALELSAVSVETSADSPLGLFAQGGSISCAACKITGLAGSAVYVEAGTLSLERSSVSVPSGEAVLALSGSTMRLSDVNLRSDAGRPLVMQQAVSITIVGSSLSGAGGTVLTGPGTRIVVSQSEFSSSGDDTNALHIESAGEVAVTDTVARGGRFGLAAVLQPGTEVSLQGGSAMGVSGGLYLEQQDQGAAAQVLIEQFSVLATGTGEQPIALRAIGPLAVVVRQSSLLSGGAAAVAAMGGAQLKVDRGVLSAVTLAAAAYGDVPGKVQLARTIAVPPASISSEDVDTDTFTEKYSHLLSSDAVLAKKFADLAAAAPSLPPPPSQVCMGSCPDGWPSEFALLAKQADAAAAKLATVELEVVDGAGRAMAVPFRVLTFEGELVVESADGKPVAVKAGTYLVEDVGDASISTDLDIAAGAADTARIDLADRLWIDINQQSDQPSRLVLFQPVARDQALAILRATDGGHAQRARIARRHGVKADQIDDALEAARSLVRMGLTFPKEGSDQDKVEFRAWEDAVYGWGLPALASFGIESDIGLMLDFYRVGSVSGSHPLGHLAYLEHRLGLLTDGELAALAADPETSAKTVSDAILLLNYYGASGSHEKLMEFVSDIERLDTLPRYSRDAIVGRAAALDWPEFPAIAGKLLERAVDKASQGKGHEDGIAVDATPSAFVYLAMFGTPEQKRIVADEMLRPDAKRWGLVVPLARLAVNPLPFVEELAQDEWNGVSQVSFLCPAYRARGDAAFQQLGEKIVAIFANNAVAVAATKPYDRHPAVIYNSADLTTRFMMGGCRPDKEVGKIYYRNMVTDPARTDFPGNWFPGYHSVEPMREFMLRTSLFPEFVQSSSAELVLDAWQSLQDPPWSYLRAERMALFRAFSRSGDITANGAFSDGVERRVFVVRHKIAEGEFSGAISGLVEVRPGKADGRLVLGVKLNQQPYYWGFEESGLGTAIGTEGGNLNYWAHQPYVVNGGRKLIEKISLTRGAEEIALREGPPEADGSFRFETDLPADELSKLVLTVDLALFDDRRSFEFDLFASGFARSKGWQP